MKEETQITLNKIDKRLENIETCLMKLVDTFETLTSAKSLNEEIIEIKKELLKISEERNIFNKK